MRNAPARLAVLVALSGLAWAPRAAAQSAALAEVGRDAFGRYCASCHGLSATGNGPVAAALDKPPADLTTIARRRGGAFPSAEIASTIDGRFDIVAHGTRTMPVWGRLLGEAISEGSTADEVSRGRIDALVSYLQSIQK